MLLRHAACRPSRRLIPPWPAARFSPTFPPPLHPARPLDAWSRPPPIASAAWAASFCAASSPGLSCLRNGLPRPWTSASGGGGGGGGSSSGVAVAPPRRHASQAVPTSSSDAKAHGAPPDRVVLTQAPASSLLLRPATVVALAAATPDAPARLVVTHPHAPRRRPRPPAAPHPTWRQRLRHAGRRVLRPFLPTNYPHSVTPDYTPYMGWQFLFGITGMLASTLGAHALLHGAAGEAVVAAAASTQWAVKDALGLMGGGVFAAWVGRRIDADPKRWRFRSALIVQTAVLLEVLSPWLTHASAAAATALPAAVTTAVSSTTAAAAAAVSLPASAPVVLAVTAAAAIVKAVGWIVAGATRASINRGFTLADNMGDVTAKAFAQSAVAGLIGTGTGVALLTVAAPPAEAVLAFFLPVSALHLHWGIRANRLLVTRTFSRIRLERAIAPWIEAQHLTARRPLSAAIGAAPPAVPVHTPASLAPGDPLLFWDQPSPGLHIGPDVVPYLARLSPAAAAAWADGTSASHHPPRAPLAIAADAVLAAAAARRAARPASGATAPPAPSDRGEPGAAPRPPDTPCRYRVAVHGTDVAVWFVHGANPHDHMQGIVHAALLRHLVRAPPRSAAAESVVDHEAALALAATLMHPLSGQYTALLEALSAVGWHIDAFHLLETGRELATGSPSRTPAFS
ncbi:hypothetical protein CXG81DRAFT_27026 [Caulochytrium protostelioides]|uniref:Protein root UVB sensitive/RUS domain-containing protein n=1 Tax=Caulochytrium protostelioides TaxID=1555241 RepID=A0A4P9X569_9FUNG|nr:hypothetical protein CXG81DRAFT_27026 [Caulochytrium protostelioides]|eukprot:RKP00268.1 hypothetical protein CXG81DRAFT_27026 [Caulochytrium protostelioides]